MRECFARYGAEAESICADCGINTTPCPGSDACGHAGRWEWYMVHPFLWAAVAGRVRFLCIACLERRRMGRALTRADLTDAPVNDPHPWDTPRLAAVKAGP